MNSKSQVDAATETQREAIAAVDEATIHDAVGVAQAITSFGRRSTRWRAT